MVSNIGPKIEICRITFHHHSNVSVGLSFLSADVSLNPCFFNDNTLQRHKSDKNKSRHGACWLPKAWMNSYKFRYAESNFLVGNQNFLDYITWTLWTPDSCQLFLKKNCACVMHGRRYNLSFVEVSEIMKPNQCPPPSLNRWIVDTFNLHLTLNASWVTTCDQISLPRCTVYANIGPYLHHFFMYNIFWMNK